MRGHRSVIKNILVNRTSFKDQDGLPLTIVTGLECVILISHIYFTEDLQM